MFVLGVTGPSGAGKGTACKILESKGFYHIDTDRLVPDLYSIALPKLVETFGTQVEENGTISRKKLGEIAFSSPENTERLNSILHPLVMEKVTELIKKAEQRGVSCVAVDGAALHEAHGETVCDKILCILAPKDVRLERILTRDGVSQERALLRLNAQKSDTYYRERSDRVIVNQNLKQLEAELNEYIKEISHE